MKLAFYDVDKDYISFLKKYDSKIPNFSYDKHDKFVCGIVLKINGLNYFAPVSSNHKPLRTNFIIRNEKNEPISSIRFAFMFPVPDDCIKLKDFSKEEYKYRRLLITELNYCNKNVQAILNRAKSVYKIGCNKEQVLNRVCCNFKLLEEKCLEYINMLNVHQAQKEVAVSSQFKDIDKKLKLGTLLKSDIANFNSWQVMQLKKSIDTMKNIKNKQPPECPDLSR